MATIDGINLPNAGNFQLSSVRQRSGTDNNEQEGFGNMLSNAIGEVDNLYQVTEEDTQALLSGDVDNLALVMSNATKAQMGLSLVVQVRNRVVDAYNELMRMTL